MERLKIAIQKSGRLTEDSQNLFAECSIEIQDGKRQLLAPSPNFPVDLLYLRDDDAYFSPSSVCSLQIRHLTIYLPKGRIWRQPWLVIRATTVKELSVVCDAESADIPTESLVSQPSHK